MQEQVLTAVPYEIAPCNEDEALHGKAVLLTDTEIAVLLNSMVGATAKTDCEKAALTRLWGKLFAVWQAPDTPIDTM